jgi:hypothetical protein
MHSTANTAVKKRLILSRISVKSAGAPSYTQAIYTMLLTIHIMITMSNLFDPMNLCTCFLHCYLGMLVVSKSGLAAMIIFCMSIHDRCSSVNPLFSAICASLYLRNSTPIKKLRRKYDPIKMKTMK